MSGREEFGNPAKSRFSGKTREHVLRLLRPRGFVFDTQPGFRSLRLVIAW